MPRIEDKVSLSWDHERWNLKGNRSSRVQPLGAEVLSLGLDERPVAGERTSQNTLDRYHGIIRQFDCREHAIDRAFHSMHGVLE